MKKKKKVILCFSLLLQRTLPCVLLCCERPFGWHFLALFPLYNNTHTQKTLGSIKRDEGFFFFFFFSFFSLKKWKRKKRREKSLFSFLKKEKRFKISAVSGWEKTKKKKKKVKSVWEREREKMAGGLLSTWQPQLAFGNTFVISERARAREREAHNILLLFSSLLGAQSTQHNTTAQNEKNRIWKNKATKFLWLLLLLLQFTFCFIV